FIVTGYVKRQKSNTPLEAAYPFLLPYRVQGGVTCCGSESGAVTCCPEKTNPEALLINLAEDSEHSGPFTKNRKSITHARSQTTLHRQ
ncbi:hypothetical protein, partial [Aeromonas dhakensis]|uniref:hypothetical protein n=1 Tax=Aeromonas dhakensis TaxID=196024 RepID=UPI003F7AD1D1